MPRDKTGAAEHNRVNEPMRGDALRQQLEWPEPFSPPRTDDHLVESDRHDGAARVLRARARERGQPASRSSARGFCCQLHRRYDRLLVWNTLELKGESV